MKGFAVLLRLTWFVTLAASLISCGGTPSESDAQVASVQQNVCSAGSVVSDVPSYSGVPGTPAVVHWTAAASCQMANPEFSFWIARAGDTWTNVQPFSAQATYDWTTTGLTPGTYYMNVWIREAGSTTNPYEAFGSKTFYLNGGVSCTNGGISASPLSPSPGPVTFTGISSSCSSPQYRYWVAPPGGPYALARDWGAAAFNWNTTSLAAGTYSVAVWVKDAGSSTASYETNGQMYYTLAASAACTNGTLSASPTSPAATSMVVLTAAASTCTTAQYRFYIAPPGGPYSLARDWGGATYNWNTSGLAAGRYSISVWMSSVGGSSQTTAQRFYTLLAGSACTSSVVSGAPTSPQLAGTQIVISAAAGGCSNPEYRFWLAPPGGLYSMVRDWGGSSYNWDTTGLASGTYSFSVWTRNIGSPQSNEVSGQAYYTLTFTTSGSNVKNFASGLYHTCVLRADGTVDCWGLNSAGQIGDGTALNVLSPVAVPGVSAATAVAAGYYHTCATVSGGAVSCWGEGASGQLGNGAFAGSLSPVAVTGLSGVTSLAGGAAHTCAVLGNTSVNCWGYSSQGAIGNGSTSGSATPVAVTGLTGAVTVSAGYYHSCALLSTGRVSCWGGNAFGQLGNGTTTRSLTPVTVPSLQDVVALVSSSSHNCALISNHTIKCWGYNAFGGNGDGTTTNTSTPTLVSGINNAVAVSISPDHGCATLQDGTAKCWGLNVEGELGNGNTTNSLVPVAVTGLLGTNVSAIGAAWRNSCALFADNTVNCWGYGAQGELGNGTTTSSLVPVAVTLP